MADIIKATRGLKIDFEEVPLLLGEPGLATDEERLYIGGNNGNIPLPNAADLSERVKKSTVAITYYVSSTGLDTNDGLTSGTAFKTIQHAIDNLPQIINHTININIASGTYNETVNIRGFLGEGTLSINGGNTYTNAINYTVQKVNIINCICIIVINGISTITTDSSFNAYSNMYVKIISCACSVSTALHGIVASNGGTVYINSCGINNKNSAMLASQGALIIAEDNVGSGNSISLNSIYGATISKVGTKPIGTTSEYYNYGGVIR